MKKFLALTLSLVMLVSCGLTGCGDKSDDATKASDETTKASDENSGSEAEPSAQKLTTDPVKLVVWGAIAPEKGPQDIIDEFTTIYPNVEIEYVRYTNDDTGNLKLDTALMAGQQIDLFFSYGTPTSVKRIEAGYAEKLDTFLDNAKFDMLDNFGEGYLTVDDSVYSMPTTKAQSCILINKDILDAKGLTVPDEWTYDEYREFTKKLTETVDGQKIYGGSMNYGDCVRYIETFATEGADRFYNEDGTESNFDDPIFKTALEYIVGLMSEDKSHISQLEYETSNLTPQGEFLNKKSATVMTSFWVTRYVKDSAEYPHDFITTIAPMPTMEKGVATYDWPGLGNDFMINSNCKNKEFAFEFLKYWATEGGYAMTKAGKIPAWKNIDMDKVITGILGEDAEKYFDVPQFKKLMTADVKFDVPTYTTAAGQLDKIWKSTVETVLAGDKTIDEALADAKKQGDEAIKFS